MEIGLGGEPSAGKGLMRNHNQTDPFPDYLQS